MKKPERAEKDNARHKDIQEEAKKQVIGKKCTNKDNRL